MLKTPLSVCHESLGARMTDFSGWYLPVLYDGIVAEHHRTRNACAIFDTCHMGRLELSGADAMTNLARLVTVDALSMADGQCRYGFLLDEDASVLDDMVVYRFRDDKWWIVVNAATRIKDKAWIQERLEGSAVLADLTERIAKVDIQGPHSAIVTSSLLRTDLSLLPRFRFVECLWQGSCAVVSRTGYTGETGFEVYVDASSAAALWDAAVVDGAAPAGLGARDTLRLEAALPLYGHELTTGVTPVEAGFARFVTNRAQFVGRQAFEARMAIGPGKSLTGFRLRDRRTARNGDRLLVGGREVGLVTSGSFSPTLGHAIALGYIDSTLTKPGQCINVRTDRGELDAEVAPTPFYRRTAG